MKKAIGFYLSAVTLVLSVVALVAYLVNCGTAYFSGMGTNTLVVCCFAGSAVLSLIGILLTKVKVVSDLALIAAPAAMVYGLMALLNDRVAGIASIFTFENNAANMADLTSCLIALAVALVAVILGVVSCFTATANN